MMRPTIKKLLKILIILSLPIGLAVGSTLQNPRGFRNIASLLGDLGSAVIGTADQITVTDNGDNTITLSTPSVTRYFTNLVSKQADSSASGAVTVIADHDGTGNKSYLQVSSGSGAEAGVIVFEYIVPDFWVAWTGANSISIWTRSSDFANCTFVVTMEDGSGNIDATISGSDIAPGSDNTWAETTLEPGSAVTPGETIRLIFTATNADANDTSWLATDVQISYLTNN